MSTGLKNRLSLNGAHSVPVRDWDRDSYVTTKGREEERRLPERAQAGEPECGRGEPLWDG